MAHDSASSNNSESADGDEHGRSLGSESGATSSSSPGSASSSGPTSDPAAAGESVPPDHLKLLYDEMERQFYSLFSKENRDTARQTLGEITVRGKETVQFAHDLISELATEITGVKSFEVKPRPPMDLDVEIISKSDREIPLRRPLAPMVELRSVCFDEKLKFGARVDKEDRGLRLDVEEGLALKVDLSPLIGVRRVPIRGSATLKRDDRKQLVLITTVKLPGIETPVTVRLPIKQLFQNA